MSAILYGNLSVEIASNRGARIERATLRQAATDMLRPQRSEARPGPLMLGRERESADAFAAIGSGRPVGFQAACGYGKTTLLQHIAAAASERGVATSCIYLRAEGNRVGDLLQQLVARLYSSDRPVKLTPEQCAQLLGQASAVIAIDDVSAGPDQVGYLLDVLSGCRVVIGSARPVLGRRGSSQDLTGLSDEAALALIASNLGRPLSSEELPAARRLTAAVDAQPLRLRQAAALVREGRHSVDSLARMAEGDPGVLDRLGISALAEHERRALAVLALAAGALLPAGVVAAIGQLAYLGECLELLGRRGLVEQRDDRFGLPVCKAGSYRQMLLKDLNLAASARELGTWLAAKDPTTTESQSAAEAALAILEFAAERGDWPAVTQLAKAAEPVFFIAGRWEAWHHVLSAGLEAARATANSTAEALFSHQLGSLAFCQDRLDDAVRQLRHALTLREQAGDREGAELTRHNLRLLNPAPPQVRPRAPRRVLRPLAGVLGAVAVIAGTAAVAGAIRDGGPKVNPPVTAATKSVTPSTTPGSSPVTTPSSSPTFSSPASPGNSDGSARLIPDVVGRSQAVAASMLRRASLKVGGQTQQCSDTVGPGRVIASMPPANTPVRTRSAVNLVESSGSCHVVVPDVTGQTQSGATATLQEQRLTASSATTTACDASSNGTVLSQQPQAGQSVLTGSTVNITVCNTPVIVPMVIGKTQDLATTTLQDAGLTVNVMSTSHCDASLYGIVVSQSPSAGTPVPNGSLVTITVCAASSPSPALSKNERGAAS